MAQPKFSAATKKSYRQAHAHKSDSHHPRATNDDTKTTPSSSSPRQQLPAEPLMHVTDSNTATSEGDPSIMYFDGSTTNPADGTHEANSEVEGEQETAAQRVFRMSEIVEVILDNLTATELFRAVRINRTFIGTIAKLPRFHQDMFLTPSKVYHTVEWDVDSETELPDMVTLNPRICSDEWAEDHYCVELEDYLGLDKAVDRCGYLSGYRVMPRKNMMCFCFVAIVTSKDKILLFGLGLPTPVLRTYLTQPVFDTDFLLKWPSQALTDMIRITEVGSKHETETVVVRADVTLAPLGTWLVVAKALAVQEPTCDDWIRVFSMGGTTSIEVYKAAYPLEIQELLCSNPTYWHVWTPGKAPLTES